MASSDPKFDQITTESQENFVIQMADDDRGISSSEFSTTDYSSDSSESPQAKRAAINCAAEKNNNQTTTQNGLPRGLVLEPAKEDLGAFVIQMDATHWQHELQILSAMSTNTLLKVTANRTLNGKRIIRPRDSATQLWLQSCSSISGKPVKFTQLIRKTTVTAVLLNVHPFISMEALLMDDRISSAERISTYNPSTKCMVHGTIQVSQSHSKYEKCAIRTAYKLHRPILRTFICYQASSLLSVSAVWSSSCCMFSKAGTLQYVQWTSSYAAVYRQNPELRISEIKMCKLWRGTFRKQQSMQCSPRKNAA